MDTRVLAAELAYERARWATDLALARRDPQGVERARNAEEEAHHKLLQIVQHLQESKKP